MTRLPTIRLVGYTDEWRARPGDVVRLHVSCTEPTYDVSVVRLRHGDLNPLGPGFRAERVPTDIDGPRPGRLQELRLGSYVAGPQSSSIPGPAWTLATWAWPTAPALGREQALFGWWDCESGSGAGLILSPRGELLLRLGDGSGNVQELASGALLRAKAWVHCVAAADGERLVIDVLPRKQWPGDPLAARRSGPQSVRPAGSEGVVAGAARAGEAGFELHFNGKLDRPTVWARVLDEEERRLLAGGGSVPEPVLAWDFSREQHGQRAVDVSGRSAHGRVVNVPQRAVTGFNWKGLATSPDQAAEEYGAIWFHDDDLDDAGWDADLELWIPDSWPSGIYAFHLETDGAEPNDDYVPFVVRPPTGRPASPAALLLPTYTYVAYANEHIWSRPVRLARVKLSLDEFLRPATPLESASFRFILEHRLHSIYDDHTDGSGVAYSSRRRPVLNFRPRYNKPALRFRGAHLLNCDLYLVDWLLEEGIDVDVLTDEDLHAEGVEVIASYRALVTGSHPEYWTSHMLDALDEWLERGGRLMYLGGNGFYWATSVDPERPWILEQRRGETGERAWTSEGGEVSHSTTGERGGLWRFRGRTPQEMLGIGFTAQGADKAQPYRRTEASHDPRVAFIVDGVDEELIGDFGLHLGGAAGWELDRADTALGTPPHTLVVASSFGHGDGYHQVIEEQLAASSSTGGGSNPRVRADMTFFEGPNGGAVFSVGSISWVGSLSHAGYRNAVARITGNVLRRFAAAEPIPAPSPDDYYRHDA